MNAITDRLGKLLDEPNFAFLIVTEMLLLQMVANNPIEMGNQGGFMVFLHITLICFLQMAILARLHRIARTRGVAAVCVHRSIFAAFLVFNVYSVFLIHIPSESEIFVYKNHISVVLLVVFLLLFSVKLWKPISVSLLAFGLIVSVQFLLKEVALENEEVAMPKMAAAPTFERRPNVYFLSFDALIPTDVVKFFLRQPEPEYSVYLKEHEFREVKDSFAVAVPTRPSLNNIAAIDTNFCDRLGEVCLDLVTGKHPSPLYTIFKKNGYETVFANRSNYFGNHKGPYVDRYIVRNYEVCFYTPEKWAFLGYCWLEIHTGLNLFFKIINPVQSVETLIASGIETSPHFLMTYTFYPTHTPSSYDTYNPRHFNFYQNFFQNKQTETIQFIETFMEAIKKRDPNSIVIVFGDHGAWISRSWKKNLGEPDPAGIVWTEDLMITERHKVALFVYPKDFCVDEISDIYTLNRLGRSVAKCLSNGQDPFSEKHRDGDLDWARYVLPE